MHGNRIKRLIEQRLLAPSYVGMLIGLLVRSVSLVLSAATPYGTWPLWLRLGIELVAALGMVVCSDIVLASASATSAALGRQIAAVQSSRDYEPPRGLSREKHERAAQMLGMQRDLVLAGLRSQLRQQLWAVFGCGFITVAYGILFAVTILRQANAVTILTEVIGVASIPFITWYLSAAYQEEAPHSPEETARGLVLAAVDARIEGARERVTAGTETQQDVQLLKVGVGGNPYHAALVAAMARPDTTTEYLSVPDLYRRLGVITESARASVRRRVRQAGEAGRCGVMREAGSVGAWRIPAQALLDLFPHYFGAEHAEQLASSTRTPPITPRTEDASQSAPEADSGEHESNTARTAHEHPALSYALHMASEDASRRAGVPV